MTAVQIHQRAVSKAQRKAVIDRQGGVCKRSYCDAPAVDVDHVLPLWSGGTNANDNLEALCVDCHKQKTAAEAKARAKAKRIEARENGTRRPRKPIANRVNAWPPKGSVKLPTKKSLRALVANDDAAHRPQESQP
jgi:5-methylcytosine-specific restriction endonuclease McrA